MSEPPGSCGRCKYSVAKLDDLTSRICKEGPPSPLIVPTATGLEVKFFYPMCKADEAGCWRFKAALELPESHGLVQT